MSRIFRLMNPPIPKWHYYKLQLDYARHEGSFTNTMLFRPVQLLSWCHDPVTFTHIVTGIRHYLIHDLPSQLIETKSSPDHYPEERGDLNICLDPYSKEVVKFDTTMNPGEVFRIRWAQSDIKSLSPHQIVVIGKYLSP